MKQRALTLLQDVFGYADFRGQQAQIIEHVVQGGSALVLMPTGGGKSLCYQIPALMQRGLAVVVSPLIALMQDQVAALTQLGIAAACLNSATASQDARAILRQARAGTLKLLYIAPERLRTPGFFNFLATLKIVLFAIDEAHCVSHWGHNFRPEYQQLGVLADYFPTVPKVALTATADQQTRADILYYLRLADAKVFLASFARPNLLYRVVEKHNAKKQLLRLIQGEYPATSGIVYCLSRKRVENLAMWLTTHGVQALPYHAGLPHELRERHQRIFLCTDNTVMVATLAFGMGIDKPDIRFVAHVDLPKSPENFYQESGRAGRDGLPATSWVCYGLNDVVQLSSMIQQAAVADAQKQIELTKLDAMLAFCETPSCRRQYMLTYFDEQGSAPCGQCDNCIAPAVLFDASVPVQQLLSCIYRTGQRYPASHIIDIMVGNLCTAVRAYGHDHLSTFGIGRSLNQRSWRAMIRQLVAKKLLVIDVADGQALVLTEACRAVLRKEQAVWLRPVGERALPLAMTSCWLRTERAERLWQAIRHWRKARADEYNVPAYTIFSDRTLRDLVELCPSNATELARIHGIGRRKVMRYGSDLLALLRSHHSQN